MPVTFETNLADLRPQPYVQQLPLDEMFRGLGYKQAEYDQGVQQARAAVQNVANLIRGYGPDEEAAATIKQQLNDNLKQFAGLDYSDPANINKLNTYVSSVANNPEVLGIASRTNKYEADQRRLREYQEKGKEVPLFLQPSLLSANKYYSSGQYDPNARFHGDITTAPDMEKIHKAVIDKLQPDIDAHGNESITPERYAEAFKTEVALHPELRSYFNSLHDSQYGEQNWDDIAQQQLGQQLTQERNLATRHNYNASRATSKALRDAELQAAGIANQKASLTEQQLRNPNKGEAYHRDSKTDFLNQFALERGKAFAYKKEAHWADQLYQKHLYDMEEIRLQNEGKLETAPERHGAGDINYEGAFRELDDVVNNPPTGEGTFNPIGPSSWGAAPGYVNLPEVPGVFNSKLFSRGKTTRKDIKIVLDANGDPAGQTEYATNVDITPETVQYNPTTKRFKLMYPGDNTPTYYTADEVKLRYVEAHPALKGILGKTATTTTAPAAASQPKKVKF